MTAEQLMVKEFMQVMEQPVRLFPEIPPFEERKLRARLILEEALETIKALGFEVMIELPEDASLQAFYQKPLSEAHDIILEELHEPNLVEIADGLADLHYVGYCGTGICCGLDMENIFSEVHLSNMSKLLNKKHGGSR